MDGPVLLVEIQDSRISASEAENHLKELKELARTLGWTDIIEIVVRLREISRGYLIGSGKVSEIQTLVNSEDIPTVVFDYDLTPLQQRNLEKIFETAVIDRQEIILEIFAERARTREAVLQVALARMRYSLPRLTRAWTHLSRQRGGVRGNRGKGETQLEYDRRKVLDKITVLEKELEKIVRNRAVRRKKRSERPEATAAFMGYTNAGKSSLLNALTDAGILEEDKLFATLDPTCRRYKLPGGKIILLTDTVGFIRKLPHSLIEAFKSTLEEAAGSDIIIHVLDASNPEWQEHWKTTKGVLQELGADETPQITVFNKLDLVKEDRQTMDTLRILHPDAVFVSARTGEGLEDFSSRITEALNKGRPAITLFIPYSRWDLAVYIRRNYANIEEIEKPDGIRIRVNLDDKDYRALSDFISFSDD